MAMVCPQCNGFFEQRLQCPQCGVRLQYWVPRRGRGSLFGHEEPWQQTPWGRLIVGLLMAQGLYYVLRHLVTAGLLAANEDTGNSVWAALTGLIVVQGLQAAGVLAAGLLTGAGQRSGFILGAVVGMWNGVLFILAQYWLAQEPLTAISLVEEPILQVAFGALGGLAGSLIWKPLPVLSVPVAPRLAQPIIPLRKASLSFAGPIAWARVLLGIAVAVGGVVWVDVIREFVLQASEGKLRIDTQLETDLVTWEISALAILAGSVLAGAGTNNGIKQGLCVGIGTTSVLFGIRLAGPGLSPEFLIVNVLTALFLSLVGGWFGSQLLPPVIGSARRRRMRAASL